MTGRRVGRASWPRVLVLAVVLIGCARGELTRGTDPPRAPNPGEAANNTPAQNKQLARDFVRREYPKWDDPEELHCLESLWFKESGWNHRAVNKRTGACGIPQSNPCKKMADSGKKYGVDYRRNPYPQIDWGLHYIAQRYGSPCAAWKKFQRGGGY